MQFSVVAIVAAFAAVASASYGNSTAPYPTGTGVASTTPSSTVPFTGAAAPIATGSGAGMALLAAAGGVALLI